MKKKIIIIGGGISGLTAGIYALKYGFDAVIVERNPEVGGLCTGWFRKGFYLDGCTHWFNGTLKGSSLYKDWHFMDAIKDDTKCVTLDAWYSFDINDKIVSLYSSLEKTERELLENFPADSKAIKKFIKMVRSISKFNLPTEYPSPHLPLKSSIKLIGDFFKCFPTLIYSIFVDKNKYVNKKFKSPELRFALTNSQNIKENLYTFLYSYSSVVSGNGGIPLGGSLEIAKRMRNKFETMGGTVYTNSEVNEIIIKNKKVSTIKLKNGINFDGDYFISAVEPDYLFDKLIDKKYKPNVYKRMSTNTDKYVSPSCVLIYLAVKDMIDINVTRTIKCEPYKVGENVFEDISIRSYSYDPIYKKDDKTVVQIYINQTNKDYDYWENLHQIYGEYLNVKREIANNVIERIVNKYPILKDKIEVLDIVTPMTFKRYVNASKGCYMTYSFTNDAPMLYTSGKVKNINNLYLASQWVITSGGLPVAMMCGKFASMRIAKKEKVDIYK